MHRRRSEITWLSLDTMPTEPLQIGQDVAAFVYWRFNSGRFWEKTEEAQSVSQLYRLSRILQRASHGLERSCKHMERMSRIIRLRTDGSRQHDHFLRCWSDCIAL